MDIEISGSFYRFLKGRKMISKNSQSLTKFEKIWLIIFCNLIIGSTLYTAILSTDYSNWYNIVLNLVISPLSAFSGIMCVLFVAKGKISNYYWGLFNCISYAYIAFIGGYYGDMILNLFWFIPTTLIGIFIWKKMVRPDNNKYVAMKKMRLKNYIFTIFFGLIFTVLFAILLLYVDSWITKTMQINNSIYGYIDRLTPIVHLGVILDASTETFQIIATILLTLAYREQWFFWIFTNIISIILWVLALIADRTTASFAIPIIIMWFGFLTNSIYGYLVWTKNGKVKQYG